MQSRSNSSMKSCCFHQAISFKAADRHHQDQHDCNCNECLGSNKLMPIAAARKIMDWLNAAKAIFFQACFILCVFLSPQRRIFWHRCPFERIETWWRLLVRFSMKCNNAFEASAAPSCQSRKGGGWKESRRSSFDRVRGLSWESFYSSFRLEINDFWGSRYLLVWAQDEWFLWPQSLLAL